MGIEFLSHTWPIVFGAPGFLILSALVGSLYELRTRDRRE
jgi:hypothetical protein